MPKDPIRPRPKQPVSSKPDASRPSRISRRAFLHWTALSAGAFGVGLSSTEALAAGGSVCLVADPADSVASAEPVRWAAEELGRALADRGIKLQQVKSISQAPASGLCIVVAGRSAPLASTALKQSAVTVPDSPECLAFAPARHSGRPILLACGSDARGLMYALLELADRARYAENPLAALKVQKPLAERPFNEARSIGRLFVSDVEDKPWFYDREMWPAYFSMLANQRFNRFSLNFGIGYDSLVHVTDAYLLFAYPFLVAVPGYDVRAVNLPDAERDRNLETLQFISQQAVAHGIDFQLGIWTHGYQWKDSPNPNYTIAGITPENHAAYSRDALAAVLKACPAISGVTIRTHGESGVPEGSYSFWKTVFDGVPKSGRQAEIDLHTKGLDETMIDRALSTGMPVRLSPKYWAEHMGMPYQQTAIRELEMAESNPHPSGYYALSSGTRSFTRYGYADFLREDRPYTVMFRIWPGTHRFLLWGDPATSAAHARAFSFVGCNGVELYEPLSFKGRRGSGLPGGRCAYADASLKPHWDWEKYLYTYRTWGRLLYNPETEPEVWRRPLRREFHAQAPALEASVAAATRIVPIITATHLPSAANDTYGPEFYTNQSILDPTKWYPYGDTPAPKIFVNVSPLDPQMFSRMSDFAGELLKGECSGKYSPIEVAQWLEDLAHTAATNLDAAEKGAASHSADFRRMAADIRLQAGLGRFFATKFRSGVLFAIHDQSGDRTALEESLKAYRRAREIWSELAEGAKNIYVSDITFGPRADERGHWLDRLPAIDADIAEMAERLDSLQVGSTPSAQVHGAIQEALGHPHRTSISCVHTPPERFTPDQPVELQLSVSSTAKLTSVRLYYRHVNQAEHYESAEMELHGRYFRTTIPASYAGSTYPLQYYFELKQGADKAWLYPGFSPDLSNQPYFVVRSVVAEKTG
jgi:hypothetical protein